MFKYLNDFKDTYKSETITRKKYYMVSQKGIKIEVYSGLDYDIEEEYTENRKSWIIDVKRETFFAEWIEANLENIIECRLISIDGHSLSSLKERRDYYRNNNDDIGHTLLNEYIQKLCKQRRKYIAYLVKSISYLPITVENKTLEILKSIIGYK